MPRPIAGTVLPDVTLPDTTGAVWRLADLPEGDPLVLHTYRGWFCPKERAYFRQVLLPLQEVAEVGYVRMVSVSVEPPEVTAAFRAGLDARWTFLSDVDRAWQSTLDLREVTDTVHDPYLPTVLICAPDLTVRGVRRVLDVGAPVARRPVGRLARRRCGAAPGLDGTAWLTSPGWRCSTRPGRGRWR